MNENEPGPITPAGSRARRAHFWERLVATIVDGIVVSIIIFLAGRVMGIEQPDIRDPDAELFGANYFLSVMTGLLYFGLMEGGTSGQTLGKRVVGIRVTDIRTGGVIGVPRAMVRHIGRFVSTIPLLLGYLWMLWDAERQTWHDKFVRAVVVHAEAGPS